MSKSIFDLVSELAETVETQNNTISRQNTTISSQNATIEALGKRLDELENGYKRELEKLFQQLNKK